MLINEEKRLTEIIERNKELETTNFILKDQFEIIKEKLARVEIDEQNLTHLISKLEAEKDKQKFSDLIANIKNARAEQQKSSIHIDLMEKEAAKDLAQDIDKSFDFLQEVSKIPKLKPRVVERFPRNLMINSNIKRSGNKGKHVLLKNKINKTVMSLIDQVMKEKTNVMAMPKKLLLRIITTTYAEMLMPWVNSSRSAYPSF